MSSKNQYMLYIIGIMSLIVILLTPYCFEIDLGPGPNRFLAILWEYRGLDGFRWFTVFQYVPIYIFRFIPLYYMMKYLANMIPKKKALMITLIIEIIPLLISIPGVLILSSEGENYIPIMISIPILFLYNLILIFAFSNRKLVDMELKSI